MRHQDWRGRLSRYVEEVRNRPYDEDTHNCGILVAGGMEAVLGEDPAAAYRRHPTLRRQLAAIRRDGHADHVEAMAAAFEEIHPAMARIGDVVAMETELDAETGWALGLVLGETSIFLSPEGLRTVHTTNADRAFRI